MSDQSIVVHEFGSRGLPLLVLVHGLSEAGTAWPDAVRRWGHDWHLLALDQRGHGSSPRFAPEELTSLVDVWVRDLTDVLSGSGEPAIVVGHSLGGRVATAVALSQPDLVRGLILEDPAFSDDSVNRPGFIRELELFLATFDQGTAPEKARMRADSSWSDDEIDAWADCKPLVDRQMIHHLNLGDISAATALGALTVPALVLYDADGPLAIDPSVVTNPLVRIECVAGVGHCIRRDDPMAYHHLVDTWLRHVP